MLLEENLQGSHIPPPTPQQLTPWTAPLPSRTVIASVISPTVRSHYYSSKSSLPWYKPWKLAADSFEGYFQLESNKHLNLAATLVTSW